MTDSFSVDSSEIGRLIADLGQVADQAPRYVRAAVEVGARNNKDDWRDFAKAELAGGSAKHFPQSITYDVEVDRVAGGAIIRAEIGPDKDRRQGPLGNLIEYGSVNNAPKSYGANALKANEADFEKGLIQALNDAERALSAEGSVLGAARAIIRGGY